MFTENILSLKSAEKRQQSLVWAGKNNMCVAWIMFNENQEKRSYIVSCVNKVFSQFTIIMGMTCILSPLHSSVHEGRFT